MISDTLICPTHGEIDLTKAAGCPECVRELRDGIRGKNLLLESYAQQITALKRKCEQLKTPVNAYEMKSLRDDLRLRTDRLIELESAAQAVLDNDDPADWPACYRELDRIIKKEKS